MSEALPRLLITGTHSGVGKTTFMAGLCRALRRRGLQVATFKCGPDYLDPSYHRVASGRPCQTLDGYLMGREAVRRSFVRHARTADVSLIEGMMGFYDGVSASTLEGSSAELADWLAAPSVLLCDGSAMARSFAALVHGFATFDTDVGSRHVVGAIANHVGSAGHRALLERASAATPFPLLGALATDRQHAFSERHLGLHAATDATLGQLDAWADAIEAGCDVDRLLALARGATPLDNVVLPPVPASERCRIGIALDAAFQFYYDENLRLLEACGAKLVFFSPLEDSALPEVDGLYFGGGYPELHAAALAGNSAMLSALRAFAAANKPIYAECGGLMYLTQAIIELSGERHDMVGLIEGEVVMHERLQAIGYVEVETQLPSVLGPAGTRARGHQFRHSRLEHAAQPTLYALRLPAAASSIAGYDGFRRGKLIASYVHLHFASNPQLAQAFVDACARRVEAPVAEN